MRVGDSIIWVNKDLIPHTATSKAAPFDSTVILSGESWSTTLAKRGSFQYACTFHPTMRGTVTVR